jgi:hypothetical protein
VHFEVIGKDPDRLRSYFGELFGWHFDTPSPVAPEVSEPGGYGFLELIAAADGTGVSAAASGEDRPSSRTPCSTLACRMSRQRCTEPRTSAAHASWDP